MFARPILATALLFLMASVSVAAEFSGLVAAEIRMFFEDPLDTAQRGFGGSLSFQPEFYHEWESGSSLSVVLFGRLDSVDSKRTHLDVREGGQVRPAHDTAYYSLTHRHNRVIRPAIFQGEDVSRS
jgi:hypothetical protein